MAYIGKTLLIGMDLLDATESIVDRIQVFGRILAIYPDRNCAILLRLNGGGPKGISIPYTPDSWHAAKPGNYHLKSTGEIAENPDFLTTCSLATNRGRTPLDARREWLGTEGILPEDGMIIH